MITKLIFDPTDRDQVKAAHALTSGLMSQFESQHIGRSLVKDVAKAVAEAEEQEAAQSPGPVDNPPVAKNVREETEEEEAARKRSEAAKKAAETRRKNKEAAEAEEEANDDQEAAEAEDASQGVDPGVTLDDLRAVLAVKADEHYDAIAGELKRLGASSMSLLDKKHYAEMLTFLNAL